MAENYAPVSKVFMLRHCLDNGIHTVVFPVQGIHIGYNRFMRFSLFFTWRL